MIRDLTIQGYRRFKDFHIDGLARVNLLVGPNNSGKTSFLEAVHMLVGQDKHLCLAETLYHRDELSEPPKSRRLSDTLDNGANYQIEHIFYGFYGHELKRGQKIKLQSRQEEPRVLEIRLKSKQDSSTPASLYFSDGGIALQIGSGGAAHIQRRADPFAPTHYGPFIPGNGLSVDEMAYLWDRITLSPQEENVVKALQIIEADVERISFTSRRNTMSGILVKLRGQNTPIPLSSMGDGMRRILALAMLAAVAENGFMFVDEIDTGLYYETQIDMWRLLIETAQRLNVQIFTTTHSLDCVRAFQEALSQTEDQSAGKLLRLSLRSGEIQPVSYTTDDLTIAMRQEIEVR